MSNHPNRKQTTIRLDAGRYRITPDGVVQVFLCEPTGYLIDYTAPNFCRELEKTESWVWRDSKYQIGRRAVLGSSTDVSPNAIRDGRDTPRFFLEFDLDGIAGNSNPKIRCISGWRGTTDDRSVDAHGIVTIRKIRALKNGDIAVTVR